MAGKYTVGAVESQVWVQEAAGTEVWLGIKLAGSKGSVHVIGWMPSGKLQRLIGEEGRWRDRLRGKGREGWMMQRHRWEANVVARPAVVGRGIRGEVVGWYLPVRAGWWMRRLSGAGVRVVVQMRRVAVGRSAGAYTQAVGIRSRKEWCKHTVSRRELVGITSRLVHANGQEEVLGAGVGRRGMGGVDWSGSGGDRLEEGGEGRVGRAGNSAQERG